MDLPASIAHWIGECAPKTDKQGCSEAQVYDCGGTFLKIDKAGSLLRADTLLHGDCCLPNVFFNDTGAQFIDLGDSGLGDRHIDLYKAMWSLQYNLKTDRYDERFLDAYGRDCMDGERLSLCAHG